LKRRYILAKIEEKVEKLLKDKIEKIGYELYDVEYAKEGKNYFLRIFIDKPEGIDLNDCEKVNNEITDLLDEVDYIKETYFLEVSSPGIERVIRKDKHLQQNIGKEININLFKKDENGQKQYQGILKQFNENKIVLEDDIIIDRKNISQIKTIYNW
jgi:ribosome maturation factor RimP